MTPSQQFCQTFGLIQPIIQGPMGGISGTALVAAVSNAGALGILPIWGAPLKSALKAISATQAATEKSFAVNLRADLMQVDHIHSALDQGITILHFFWGSPAASLQAVQQTRDLRDIKIIATVGDADAAKQALDAGANTLIAQGVEAGGHVLSNEPLERLLAEVLAVAKDIPVIAAGGGADAQDLSYWLSQGAAGGLFGSRFVASIESEAHPFYKQSLIDAGPEATARSLCFADGWPDAPHRNLINSSYLAWQQHGQPTIGQRPGENDVVMTTSRGHPFKRYDVTPPRIGMTGDIEAAVMYAGTGIGKIADCPSAAEIITALSSS